MLLTKVEVFSNSIGFVLVRKHASPLSPPPAPCLFYATPETRQNKSSQLTTVALLVTPVRIIRRAVRIFIFVVEKQIIARAAATSGAPLAIARTIHVLSSINHIWVRPV